MSYADTVGQLRRAGLDRREAQAIAIFQASPTPTTDTPPDPPEEP